MSWQDEELVATRAWDGRLFRRLLRYAGPHKRLFLQSFGILVALFALDLLGPWIWEATLDGPVQESMEAAEGTDRGPFVEQLLVLVGAYLGVRLQPIQCLAIALVIPSAAALFTLGFAPIYWFLQFTMPAADAGWNVTRIVLLVLSLVLALSHVNRCLYSDARLAPLRDSWALWAGWQLLVVFLTWRMAETLGMLS